MWFFIIELSLILCFYIRNKEWFTVFSLSILYALLIQFNIVCQSSYITVNLLLIFLLFYTAFVTETWLWFLDIYPLIIIKGFEILIYLFPESSAIITLLNLLPIDIYQIDTFYFCTIIINNCYDKIYCLKDWSMEYIKDYTFLFLSLLIFIIFW